MCPCPLVLRGWLQKWLPYPSFLLICATVFCPLRPPACPVLHPLLSSQGPCFFFASFAPGSPHKMLQVYVCLPLSSLLPMDFGTSLAGWGTSSQRMPLFRGGNHTPSPSLAQLWRSLFSKPWRRIDIASNIGKSRSGATTVVLPQEPIGMRLLRFPAQQQHIHSIDPGVYITNGAVAKQRAPPHNLEPRHAPTGCDFPHELVS